MRVLHEEVRGRGQSNALQKIRDRRDRATPIARPFVTEERRGERLVDGPDRIERCVRILMDELDRTAKPRELLALGRPHVLSFKEKLPARRTKETREQPPGGGLSAATLADQAHRFALTERERHAVHGFDEPAGRLECPAHADQLDQRFALDGDVARDGHLAVAIFSETTASSLPRRSATCFQRMQRASCWGVSTARRSGSRTLHSSMTKGQRGL